MVQTAQFLLIPLRSWGSCPTRWIQHLLPVGTNVILISDSVLCRNYCSNPHKNTSWGCAHHSSSYLTLLRWNASIDRCYSYEVKLLCNSEHTQKELCLEVLKRFTWMGFDSVCFNTTSNAVFHSAELLSPTEASPAWAQWLSWTADSTCCICVTTRVW